MQFKDIVGQHLLKESLARMADSGRVGHALLFTGREGVGALPLAVAFAQYINCAQSVGGDSCGVCASCVQMNQLAHPDVHFVFPVNKSKSAEAVSGADGDKPVSDHFIAKWREQILQVVPKGYFNEQMWYRTLDIDNKQGNISRYEADRILRKLSFKAFESKYKIVIVWLPERMNPQAANALLKILEEPWENTFFLLVSHAPERLLPTILSRTQTIDVPAIDPGALSAWLRATQGLPAEKADALARVSFGNLLEALRLLSEEEQDDEQFDLFVQLMRLSYEDKHLALLEWAESVASMNRESQKAFLENTLRLLRDAYMMSMGMDEVAYLYGKELAFCRKFAPFVNNRNIEALTRQTQQTVDDVARNGNPKIVFTHYALTVSKLINRLR
ncbi:MAG: DNA polymerase III subunit delta' [Rikenellaceae bacterium]|nr:DNA polymerase III subunit delta' [Rikenellaceae bacterium]